MMSTLIHENGLDRGHYAEPYAGGCGLALSLLFRSVVHEIHVNDIDRGIWSFWHSVLNDSDNFIDMMMTTPVTLDEWHRQRDIYNEKTPSTVLEMGFALFFLNRTNRSGIIRNASVIGGKKQDGAYKIDCRFNKVALADKIRRIQKYKHRIHLYNLDAIDFIQHTNEVLPERSLYCIDPPYYMKGSTLYTNFYEHADHEMLARAIEALDRPWVLTYDNADEIRKMYERFEQYLFSLNYSVAVKRKGTELFVASPGLDVSRLMDRLSAA